MAKTGDIVRFLNSVGGGRVVRVAGPVAYVEDEDGFEVPALLKECVVVAEAGSPEAQRAAQASQPAPSQKKGKSSSSHSAAQTPAATGAAAKPASAPVAGVTVVPEPDLEVEETSYGEKLNVVLAFEPADGKSLGNTTWDCVLVNDSNYYLSFVFATRGDSQEGWTTRRAGVIEPNIVLSLCEFEGSDFSGLDRLNVQFVAYKADKDFELKRPVSVIHKVDATKFFKAHCYHESTYFDNPVIDFEIVKDDEPFRSLKVDGRQLETAMRRKIAADRRPVRREVRHSEPKRQGEAIVVDLHIDELVDNTRGMSPADMLNLQIDEFRRVMDANLNNKGQKIIFIHGKGEGVLRQALGKELNYHYKKHQVEDAPFRDYGSGATMVIIR